MSDVISREELGYIPRDRSKGWLNVVIDLNGILCTCSPKWEAKGCRNRNFHVHSATLPTEVGTKLVWVRPGCKDFLFQLSTFATITVWSSMMTSTTRAICDYLFGPISPVKPLRILGQEDCDRIPQRNAGSRIIFLKEPGTQKDIFLKTLSAHLFNGYDGIYTAENTLIIDDSPIKHMLNLPENVLLLPSWSYKVNMAEEDSTLLDKILPYLLELHSFQGSLKEYRASHLLGRPMFYDDMATCSIYNEIRQAMSD